jgi:hypothetical protein
MARTSLLQCAYDVRYLDAVFGAIVRHLLFELMADIADLAAPARRRGQA